MNVWECDRLGCRRKCYGTGGAIGLRAIGWYFKPGPVTLCPAHRPDRAPCKEHTEQYPDGCPVCKADQEAEAIQQTLYTDEDNALLDQLDRQPFGFTIKFN